MIPALLALACGATVPPAERALGPAPPAPSGSGRRLALGELRVLRHGEPDIVLHRSGLLVERGELLGTLQEDGRFIDVAGKVRAVMDADGRVALDGGEILIMDDGSASLTMPGLPRSTIRIDDAGRVIGAEARFEGLTADLRRTAALILLLPDILRWQQPAEIH